MPALLPLVLPPGRTPMFPPVDKIRPMRDGLVALGADLRPETLIEAYRKGLFPWDGRQPIPWYSPDPRLVLDPRAFHASRNLKKLYRRGTLEVRLDSAFRQVMIGCATTPREGQAGTWITAALVDAYELLHRRGIGHSVEVYEDGELVGGLYGLAMGRLFFGESMFAHRPDASKIALYALCQRLVVAGYHLVDCQQDTPHLRSLGAHLVSRATYQDALAKGLAEPDGWPSVVQAETARLQASASLPSRTTSD